MRQNLRFFLCFGMLSLLSSQLAVSGGIDYKKYFPQLKQGNPNLLTRCIETFRGETKRPFYLSLDFGSGPTRFELYSFGKRLHSNILVHPLIIQSYFNPIGFLYLSVLEDEFFAKLRGIDGEDLWLRTQRKLDDRELRIHYQRYGSDQVADSRFRHGLPQFSLSYDNIEGTSQSPHLIKNGFWGENYSLSGSSSLKKMKTDFHFTFEGDPENKYSVHLHEDSTALDLSPLLQARSRDSTRIWTFPQALLSQLVREEEPSDEISAENLVLTIFSHIDDANYNLVLMPASELPILRPLDQDAEPGKVNFYVIYDFDAEDGVLQDALAGLNKYPGPANTKLVIIDRYGNDQMIHDSIPESKPLLFEAILRPKKAFKRALNELFIGQSIPQFPTYGREHIFQLDHPDDLAPN